MNRPHDPASNPISFAMAVESELSEQPEDSKATKKVPSSIRKLSKEYASEWKESPRQTKLHIASQIIQNGVQLAQKKPFVANTSSWITAFYDMVRNSNNVQFECVLLLID